MSSAANQQERLRATGESSETIRQTPRPEVKIESVLPGDRKRPAEMTGPPDDDANGTAIR